MTIRPAKQSDADSISVLLDQLGYPASPGFASRKISALESPDYSVIVCEIEGLVAGFASLHVFDMFYTDGRMGRITAICVDDRLRDQGIGGLLLRAAETFFVKQGCAYVEVTTNIKRLVTPDFYIKHGYTENSRRFIKQI